MTILIAAGLGAFIIAHGMVTWVGWILVGAAAFTIIVNTAVIAFAPNEFVQAWIKKP